MINPARRNGGALAAMPLPLRRNACRSLLWVLAGGLLPAAPPRAQPPAGDAEQKAALTLNFARHVEWPERSFASRDAPVVFCLIGRDAFAAAFAALESRTLGGRPVRLRRVAADDDLHGCQVLYVSELDDRHLLPLLRSLAGQPVLTVGDAEGFIDFGGAIGIVPGAQRLQFEVNRGVLEQAHLKAGSQLLKLARTVLNAGG